MDEVRDYLTADMPTPWRVHCDELLKALRGTASADMGSIHLGVLESAFRRLGEFVARTELRDRPRMVERVELVLWAMGELRLYLGGEPGAPSHEQAIIYGTFARMSIKQLFLFAERMARTSQPLPTPGASDAG